MARGLQPRLQKLDNECLQSLIHHFLDKKDTSFQLASPFIHRRNTAKRAMHMLKNHFIAYLCGTDS